MFNIKCNLFTILNNLGFAYFTDFSAPYIVGDYWRSWFSLMEGETGRVSRPPPPPPPPSLPKSLTYTPHKFACPLRNYFTPKNTGFAVLMQFLVNLVKMSPQPSDSLWETLEIVQNKQLPL